MMRKIILLGLILLSVLSSCKKGNSDENMNDEDCHPEMVNSKWTEGKEIFVQYNPEFQRTDYHIIDGDNSLFEYDHSGKHCDHLTDDTWGETLSFEIESNIIESNITTFEYTDENILETNCFYSQYGAWVSHLQYQIKDGFIIGEKISENEWEVTVSVSTTPLYPNQLPKTIEFTHIFNK